MPAWRRRGDHRLRRRGGGGSRNVNCTSVPVRRNSRWTAGRTGHELQVTAGSRSGRAGAGARAARSSREVQPAEVDRQRRQPVRAHAVELRLQRLDLGQVELAPQPHGRRTVALLRLEFKDVLCHPPSPSPRPARDSTRRGDARVGWAPRADTAAPVGAAVAPLGGSPYFFPRRRQPPPGSGLHRCPVCHADFVVPVWWEELGRAAAPAVALRRVLDPPRRRGSRRPRRRFENDMCASSTTCGHAGAARPHAHGRRGQRVLRRAGPRPDRGRRLQVLIAPGRVSDQMIQTLRPISSSAQIG